MLYGTYIEPKLGTKALRHPIIRRPSVECKEKRETLVKIRQRNAKHYRRSCGRAMIWPPLPGTHFHADLLSLSSWSGE